MYYVQWTWVIMKKILSLISQIGNYHVFLLACICLTVINLAFRNMYSILNFELSPIRLVPISDYFNFKFTYAGFIIFENL